MLMMQKQPTKLLEQSDKLDKLGYYKEADRITRVVLAQENELFATSTNVSRAIQVYNYFLRYYGISPAYFAENIEIMIRATLTGQYPAGYNEAYQGLKSLFKDPRVLEGVEIFLEQYPQLKADYQLLNTTTRAAKLGNYFEWLKNTTTADEAYETWRKAQNLINNSKNVSTQLLESGHGVISDISKVNPQTLSEIENGLKAAKQFETFEKVGQRYLKSLKYRDVGRYTGERLIKELNWLKLDPGNKRRLGNNVLDDLAKYGEELYKPKYAGEMAIKAQKAAGAITKATPAAEEAATTVGKFLGPLNKFAGPLALVLSLPGMYDWISKMKSGQMDWSDADQVYDCVSDLLNSCSSIVMFVPGGQAFAAALGAVSLGIKAGQWVAHATGYDSKPNPEDLKITGQFDKLSPDQKQEYQKEQTQVDRLITDINPGYGGFNDYEVNTKKRPIQPPQYAGDKSTYYDPAKMKILDLMNDVFEWAKTTKEYSWLNQPETHSSMINSFKEKLNNWHREQKKS
jgi:hypothetical protein